MFLKKSLRLRIIVIVTALVLVLFVINAYISSESAKTRFEDLSDEKYIASADYYAELVDNWFSSNAAALMSLVAYVNSYEGTVEGMQSYFSAFAAVHEDINEAYIGLDNNFYVFSNWVPPSDYDITTRGWYTATKSAAGKIYYTEPYMDNITNALCVSMCYAINIGGLQGAVGIDLNLDNLTALVPEHSEGYTIVATDQETIIVHKNPEFALTDTTSKKLSEVLNGAYTASMKTDAEFNDYDGTESYITASTVSVNNWTVAIITPRSVYDKPINDMMFIFTLLTVVFCLITAGVVTFVSMKITGPIKIMTSELGLIVTGIKNGEGDLTARIRYKSQDELGTISSGINDLMSELNDLIPKSKSAAGSVSGHSDNLVGITGQLTQAIGGISLAVEGIAKGAMQQATDVQSATENVDQIGTAIDSVAATTSELNEIAMDMQQSSMDSERQISNLQESTNTMVEGIERISEQIKDTSIVVDKINGMVATISKIASQTNLLSLNASIEAARAGESGKSFAVVAQEIGMLAINSADAAENIKNEMNELLNTSETTVKESKKVHELTVTQQNVLNETTQTIRSLLSRIDTTIAHINDIEKDVNNCVSAKNVIVDAMTSLSAISQQNAASSEETSATTAEINNSIGDLSNAAQGLSSVASELTDSLNIFK